jgi:hypothetical protein
MSEEIKIPKTLEELKEQGTFTEEELLALGLGIVPLEQTAIAPPLNKTIEMIDGSMMNYMHDHVVHWLNEYVYERTINLPQADKDRYFQMITDYGDILAYLINDDNNIIYEYVKGEENPWAKLEKHAENSDMVIDYEKPKQLIKEYEEWKARKVGTN